MIVNIDGGEQQSWPMSCCGAYISKKPKLYNSYGIVIAEGRKEMAREYPNNVVSYVETKNGVLTISTITKWFR
jgi:hypothetical protein